MAPRRPTRDSIARRLDDVEPDDEVPPEKAFASLVALASGTATDPDRARLARLSEAELDRFVGGSGGED
jgi:hypothetical protein